MEKDKKRSDTDFFPFLLFSLILLFFLSKKLAVYDFSKHIYSSKMCCCCVN